MRLITNKSKNLFDYHKASKILGSANLSKQPDFTLIATQTHKNEYTSVEVELDKSFVGKTVTLSALAKTSSINNPNLRIQWFKSDGLATGKNVETKNTSASSDFIQISVTGTVPENPGDGDYLCLCFYSNKDIDLSSSTESSFSATYKNIQLEIGTEVTTYQPHTWNLLNKWQYPATQTLNGITWTNNGDGTITANGTTNEVYANYIIPMPQFKEVKNDHKYVLFSGINDINVSFVECIFFLGRQDGSYFATNCAETKFADTVGFVIPQGEYPLWQRVELRVRRGYTANGLTFKPQLYDLTLMYGAGNEPTTVDQFYQDYPMLKIAPLGFLNLKNLEIGEKNVKRLKYKTANGFVDLGIIPSSGVH